MKSIWSGTLSFGLLSIPVKLFSAAKEHTLSFHLLDKKDHCPISYKKVCKLDDHPVEQKDIVKGYEYEKNQYVILEKEDFKKANARKTGTIEILSFADVSMIDERYYSKPYFIIPEDKSVKAYALLRDAIRRTGMAGVARFVLREKEHIALIKINSELMTLIQLRYEDELLDPEEFKIPKTEYSKKELAMAISLIENLTEPFTPSEYKDTYTNELMNIIEAKAKGKKVVAVGRKPVPTPLDTESVLKLLEESMKKTKQ